MTHERPHAETDNTDQGLLEQVRRRAESKQRWRREGDPSFARQLAAVGVLGWIIVVPTLLGVLIGRWVDHWLATGITFTAALLLLGVFLGSWSAWRWMHDR